MLVPKRVVELYYALLSGIVVHFQQYLKFQRRFMSETVANEGLLRNPILKKTIINPGGDWHLGVEGISKQSPKVLFKMF